MYAYITNETFSVQLSEEDVLSIQELYGDKNMSEISGIIPEAPTTTRPIDKDLCSLKLVDSIFILENRIYISYKRYVWSIDINGKTYDKPLLLRDYIKFFPTNFMHATGAYQNPSDNLVLFLNNMVYKIHYPSLELAPIWPRSLTDLGFPANMKKINAVINTNKGRIFIIYDNHIAAEIDDCSMKIAKYHNINAIFPGISSDITSAFKYIDGNLYFINRQQFYRFNKFTKTITAGAFDLQIINVLSKRRIVTTIMRSDSFYPN